MGAIVVEHLADSEQERGDENRGVEHGIGGDDGVELVGSGEVITSEDHGDGYEHGDHGTSRVRDDHQQPPIVPIRQHAGRQGEQQPWKALHDDDDGDEQRVAGDR